MNAGVSAPPRRRKREETRGRLMDAAVSVLGRCGFDRATVDDIVREAGFSKGAFYVHFESKEDLFWAILQERIARQQDALLESIDHDRPVAENVRTILSGVFGLLTAEPIWGALYREFDAHAFRNEKVRERLAAMYDRWRDILVELLNESRDSGRIRADVDAEFTATLLIAAVEGSILQARISPDRVRLEEMVEPLTRALTEWLAP